MEQVLDTGVQPLEAAADEATPETNDDNTPSEDEGEAPEISLEELLDGADEGNAEQGLDSPPSPKPTEEPAKVTPTEPAVKTFTQAELDKIVQTRLKQQADGIEKKNAAQKAADAEIETKAKQYIEEHPEMKNQPEMVKAFLKMQQPQVETVDDGVERYTAEEHEASRKTAWQESLTKEEPELRELLGDPNFSIREAIKKESKSFNPVLALSLSYKLTPKEAGYIARTAEDFYGNKAAAAAEQEVLEKIKNGNARVVTPAPAAKGSGKPMSDEERYKNMSYADWKASIRKAESMGGKGIYIGQKKT
jgi:uncharacterized protein (DUF2225 family)